MLARKVRKVVTGIFLISLISVPVSGETGKPGEVARFMASPVANLKKTVVFLGRIEPDGRPNIYATGFLVNVQNTFQLITAKHVVVNRVTGRMQDGELLAFFNLRDGGVAVRSFAEMKERFNMDWIFHPDPQVDVAMIPFQIDPMEDDVKVVSDSLFLSSDYLFELYDIFFLSYQPGIEPKGKITPIVRNGIISLINDDRTFYIDASAFPGNTGSPVFLTPSTIRFDRGGLISGDDPLGGHFIGIIGEYIPYQELAVSAQTGRPRIIFEENTGLSRVWSVSFIKEIINSDAFKQQLKRIASK